MSGSGFTEVTVKWNTSMYAFSMLNGIYWTNQNKFLYGTKKESWNKQMQSLESDSWKSTMLREMFVSDINEGIVNVLPTLILKTSRNVGNSCISTYIWSNIAKEKEIMYLWGSCFHSYSIEIGVCLPAVWKKIKPRLLICMID